MSAKAQPSLIQTIPCFMVGRLLFWQSKKPKHKDKPRPCPLAGGYSVGYEAHPLRGIT